MQPPKWLPIFISIFALAISGLSLWESNRARLMAEETNRPVLELDGITAETLSSNGSGEARVRLTVRLKNIGKTTAAFTKANVFAFIPGLPDEDKCIPTFDPNGNIVSGPNVEVLVGLSYRLGEEVKFSNCKEFTNPHFVVHVTTQYTDMVTGKLYSQNFLSTTEMVSSNPAVTPSPK